MVLDDVLERLPEMPNLDEIRGRAEEPSPYTMVALQARILRAPDLLFLASVSLSTRAQQLLQDGTKCRA